MPLLLQLLPVLGEHVMLGLPGQLLSNLVLVLGGQDLVVNNGLDTVLVVVDVPLPVNGLDLLDSLVSGDVLLDDGGGSLGADLGGVGLAGASEAMVGEGRGAMRRTMTRRVRSRRIRSFGERKRQDEDDEQP